mgnify:FL=1
MQSEMNKLVKHTQSQLERESEVAKKLAKMSAKRLVNIKKDIVKKDSSKDGPFSDDWEIEYDE